MKLEKITLPVAILLSAIILAVGFYAVQYSQQKSIERQQQIEIDQEAQRQLLQEQEKQEEEVRIQKQAQITIENNYWNDLKNTITNAQNAGYQQISATRNELNKQKDLLFKSYAQSGNASYYELVPLIKATEDVIPILENYLISLEELNKIRAKQLTAISERNEKNIEILDGEELSATDSVRYWFSERNRQADVINNAKQLFFQGL